MASAGTFVADAVPGSLTTSSLLTTSVGCFSGGDGLQRGYLPEQRASTLRDDDERPRLILVLVPQKRRTTY
jgi:hypothetical protein